MGEEHDDPHRVGAEVERVDTERGAEVIPEGPCRVGSGTALAENPSCRRFLHSAPVKAELVELARGSSCQEVAWGKEVEK